MPLSDILAQTGEEKALIELPAHPQPAWEAVVPDSGSNEGAATSLDRDPWLRITLPQWHATEAGTSYRAVSHRLRTRYNSCGQVTRRQGWGEGEEAAERMGRCPLLAVVSWGQGGVR
jgi:hypothetical protein